MSFPRYPEYKNSGVEWLGAVPAHWEVKRIKRLVATLEQGWSPQCEGFPVQSDDEWGVLKVGCVNGGVFRPEENKALPPELEPVPALGLAAGDLLISRANTRELVGGAAIVLQAYPRLMLCDKLYRIRLHPAACVPTYLASYLGTAQVRSQIELAATGASSSMLNIGQSTILELETPVPPLSEQTAITTFLDHETAKIDTLVAEQEKLIALLQEKRQAAISHAVTKGLDPNAPMKDSGVEWLGEVPAHWEALTLRRCAVAVQTGGTPSAEALIESLDEGFVWYTPGDFGSSLKLSTSTRRITNEAVASGEAKLFPPRSVLIVSIGATLGKVGFAHDASSANQQINAVIPDAGVDGYFLAWSLSVKAEAMRFLSNASTIGIMNQEKTKEIWIALPPRDEQAAIATFLDQETTKLDNLMTEARTAITLLQERRTALISAAVTGQIDVRGWAPSAY